MQVSDRVVSLLKARHPTCDILWECRAQRWCIVQTVRGRTELVRILGTADRYEAPTIANTVYYLDSIHPSRFRTSAAIDKFLEQMDNPASVAEAQKRAQDRIRQGSVDLWNAMNNRRVIPIKRSHDQAQRT